MTAVLVLVSCFVAASQATPAVDPSATQPAPAPLRGRVGAPDPVQPLQRVRVSLGAGNAPSAVTDTRGEFEIFGVAPGTYAVTVTRAGYLTVQYGQRRPREAGRTVTVQPGEVVEGIDIALPRG